jgi:probable selenium-dependent hydroxylase accessory protein YqeC
VVAPGLHRLDPALLASDLELPRRRAVYLIGGGGKSTLLEVLARAKILPGRRVAATTTTKVWRATGMRAPHLIVESAMERVISALEAAPRPWVFLARELDVSTGKLLGYSGAAIDHFVEAGAVDLTLVEADGAAGRALKAHAPHEPVFGALADLVIAVVGMDIIGAPFDARAVHRAELFAERVPILAGTPITWQHVAAILLHEQGYLQRVPRSAEVIVLLNKVETPARVAAATALSAHLASHPRISRVISGSLGGPARLTVEFVGPVRRPWPERRRELEVPTATAVAALLAELGYSPEEGARLTVLVDGARVDAQAPLADGARIEILLPLGGG